MKPISYDPRAHGARCDVCPLRHKRFVPPEGPPDAEIVVVGEAPGPQEEIKRRPFIGPSGMLLNDILRDADGPKRDRVLITNSLLCRPEVPTEKGKKRFDLRRYLAWLHATNKKEIQLAKREKRPAKLLVSPFVCCRPRLMVELERAEKAALARGEPNGAVVIPVGNYATYVIAGRLGIMKWRGSPLRSGVHFKFDREKIPEAEVIDGPWPETDYGEARFDE